MPYLNITAQWDGAPDQNLLEAKGGRGFPYCTIMNASGDVVWEARPTSKDDFTSAVADATMLTGLQKKLAASPDDKALAASVALLDAIGRSQRPSPELDELDAHAAVPGVDPKVLARFNTWRQEKEIEVALQKFRSDGGVAVYELYKKGVVPSEGSGMQLAFFFYGARGAIKSEDADTATKLLDQFVAEGMKVERFRERVTQDAAEMRKEIAALGDDDEDGDGGNDEDCN